MFSDSYFQRWYTKVAVVAVKLKFFCVVSLNSESEKKGTRSNYWLLVTFYLVPGMLLADEGVHSGEGTKGKDGKSGAEELVKNFLQIHESCSDKDAAPRRYMTFLKTYKQVYNEKKEGVVKRQQHLQVSK